MRNTFGNIFTLTTFGESHGAAVGGVIDGMPPGIEVDMAFIQHELDRRRPGQSDLTTSRNEADRVELLSGVFEGKTTGAPIGFIVRNTNHHSQDYENLRCLFRPSHADYTYHKKYGIRDHRGGGRTSARTTISRCAGGAFAKLALRKCGISVKAYTSQVGDIALDPDYHRYDLDLTDSNDVRCPDQEAAEKMAQLIREVKSQGDTIGGVVTCVVSGCPAGLGEPEFDKLHAALGGAMLSINAAKGFDYGLGFKAAAMSGSEYHDLQNPDFTFRTNHDGGIQGGITNGEEIYFRVAFKPIPSVRYDRETIDFEGNPVVMKGSDRNDLCVAPRVLPVVEAMAAMVAMDFWLMV